MLGDREKQAIEQGPNLGAVLDHIEFLRDANANIDQPYVLELRSLSEGATPSSLTFEPYDESQLNDALMFAEAHGRLRRNVYITVAPSVLGPKSVRDSDIIQLPFVFADADQLGAVEQIKKDMAFQPSAYICTGTRPFERGHFYWQLEAPVQPADFGKWRSAMQNIAKKHNCDPQVGNPSRIMRLGGTIAFPSKAKRARHYEIERTGFYKQGHSYG